MFSKKIDLFKELCNERAKDQAFKGGKLQATAPHYEQACTLLFNQPERRELLKEAGFSTALNDLSQLVSEYQKKEAEQFRQESPESGRLFMREHFSKLTYSYAVCLCSCDKVKEVPPAEITGEIAALKEKFGDLTRQTENGKIDSSLYILCLSSSLEQPQGKQCLLFYKLSEEVYYYVGGWGELSRKNELLHEGDRALKRSLRIGFTCCVLFGGLSLLALYFHKEPSSFQEASLPHTPKPVITPVEKREGIPLLETLAGMSQLFAFLYWMIGLVKVFIKVSQGDKGVAKVAFQWIGGALFLSLMGFLLASYS